LRALPSLIPLLIAIWIGGCSSRTSQAPVEDSLTAGRISIVSAFEAETLVVRERAAFTELYPEADLRVVPGRSSEAVRALFAADCDLAVLSRELTPEERGAAARGGLDLEGYRFAKDAVVVLVHPQCPVENLALDVLKRIYEGEVVDWAELGGAARPIEPVFRNPESDMAEFFVEEVMKGEPVKAKVLMAATDSAMVALVSSRPGALGFAPLAWAGHGTKALRLSGLTGLPYWKADLEAVHDGEYPLTRSLSFYVRASGPRLAHGFITYVTSRDGQKLVHESGLVPTSVPVRFVRRSSMRGAH
jgi:phosphate transport system substrate-binding protein